MAAATLVSVGQVNHIIDEVVEASRQIVPGENLGAVISQSAKQRIEGYITEAIEQGATILLDGRDTDRTPHLHYLSYPLYGRKLRL